MKAIIIDDEKQAIASLKMELEQLSQTVDIIGTADSVESGIALLNDLVPDVVFLDIRLGDGLGFDILQNISTLGEFRIVFTTAYDQYAIEAFKHGAIDYLLKPIDLDDLEVTMNRLAEQLSSEGYSEQIDKLLGLTNALSKDARIALNTSEGIYLKRLEDIIHVQADGNYTKFFFKNEKKPQLISRTLKDYEKILGDHGFIRIHFSHLVNIKHLDRYLPKDGGCVLMSNEDVLPVSTRKKAALLEVLKTYSKRPL